MIKLEPVDVLNERLTQRYGYFDSQLNQPKYRVVWSPEQFELRKITHNKHGEELLIPEVKKVPKYKQWADNYYILERATGLDHFEHDLVVKWSYEPLWVFRGPNDEPLPPVWGAIELIVNSVEDAIKRGRGVAQYKDPDAVEPQFTKEAERAKIKNMREKLFGNETSVGDSLAYGSGVTVPHKQFSEVKEN